MFSDKRLCLFVKILFIQFIGIKHSPVFIKRISYFCIVNLIYIFFCFTGISRMKIICRILTLKNTDRLRQICVKCSQNFFTRNVFFSFKCNKIYICMHTAVSSWTALNSRSFRKNFFQSILKCFLNGIGIFLNLPAVKLTSVISEF